MFGSAAFVGRGSGEDEVSARNDSLRDALSQMGEGLGYDLVPLYLRELSGSGRIQELGTYISDSYSTSSGGRISYYTLVITPDSGYYSKRSDEYTALLERENSIKAYLESAGRHYRANEDTEALTDTLKALDLSLSGTVTDPSLMPDKLLARAEEYLSNIRIQLTRHKNGSTVGVRLTRNSAMFSPRIINALVDAVYLMSNNDGGVVESTLPCRTGQNGQFTFSRTNPYMIRTGIIRFRIGFPSSLLQSIESHAEEGFLDDFISRLESVSCEYAYSERPAYDPSSLIIAVSSYGYDGNLRNEDDALNAFTSMLENTAVDYYSIVPGSGDVEDEVYASVRELYPEKRYVLLVRVGVVDSSEASGSVYMRAEGRVTMHDTETESVLFSQDSFAAASGSDRESAESAALAREAVTAAGRLLSVI